MTNRPIGITAGDPTGVGAEIILKALEQISARRRGLCTGILVYGSLRVLREATERDGLDAQIVESDNPSDWPKVSVIATGEPVGAIPMGRVAAEAGRVAFSAIARAVRHAMERRTRAIVTAPISKEALNLAGHRFSGHTELLANLSGTRDICMMLAHENLRVSHLSTHTALADVPKHLTKERLGCVIDLTLDALGQLGIDEPKVAVAALNPHAGEGGLFGSEDQEISAPLVERYRSLGFRVSGPISGDTVFLRAVSGEFDAVVAMFHDQGHIPVKFLGFRIDPESGRWLGISGVNVTLGLPFVRTSVDHGTAFDIAGTGVASAQSMIDAIDFAIRLSSRDNGQNGSGQPE
ncbi:MAG: 4-hydroxythreonine-4-phosphate dehydrogenase PdxA [Albidovulum sp.]|nr:4-hydroxythreonine-4-phosphate dehydrogenase PdxA [Albidovulum sp.]